MNKFECGNSLEYFKENNNFETKLILTSPSYYTDKPKRNKKDNEIGIGETKESYVSLIFEVIRDINVTMKDNSHIVLVIGSYDDKPIRTILFQIENAVNDLDFELVSYKEFSKNNSEAVVVFGKKSNIRNLVIPNFNRIQEYKKVGFYGTISTEILNWAIETFTNKNDLVLDPFAGIGTTLRIAKKLGRNYIGVELDSTFVNEGNKFLN